MIKRVCGVSTALVAALAVVGCGGGGGEPIVPVTNYKEKLESNFSAGQFGEMATTLNAMAADNGQTGLFSGYAAAASPVKGQKTIHAQTSNGVTAVYFSDWSRVATGATFANSPADKPAQFVLHFDAANGKLSSVAQQTWNGDASTVFGRQPLVSTDPIAVFTPYAETRLNVSNLTSVWSRTPVPKFGM